MDLFVTFIIFLVSMLFCLLSGYSMIPALLVGLVAFILLGLRRGFPLKGLFQMGLEGAKDSLLVIEVMCVIGFITAIWRVSGTITIFVYYGIKLITPALFLIIAYLLSCLLSYALGTSFGVAGTVGVIFMTLARSGGVDPVITAGVLMSGIYFGDRASPVSSSANMVAAITNTKILDNVKLMMKTGWLPVLLSLLVYVILSALNPISHVDQQLISTFEQEFNLSLWSFVPAILMLVLPLLKVSVLTSMGLSIIGGIMVSCFVQKVPLLQVLKICILGYESGTEGLGSILNGGGLISMMEIVVILLISCTYSGIFTGTKLLDALQEKLASACTRFGRFSIMLMIATLSPMVFCNQTIATLLCSDLLKKPYLDTGGTKEELAIDMENSVIIIACFIPWSIGCSVPLTFFDVGPEALPYAVFMYAMPIVYFFTKRRWFSNGKVKLDLTNKTDCE